MRTYSRRNSRYLKKAFIASNFNEMCRLCLSEVDMVLTPIIQDTQMSYQEWIQYSVDILVEEGDGLPPNICEECLSMVEQTYLFKKKCKASDSKLREHLQLIEKTNKTQTDFESGDTSSNKKKDENNDNVHGTDIVDPGGVDDEKQIVNCTKNSESNLKNKGKDVIKPINEDDIVIHEVKRYVSKIGNTEEKNVCEVVHYDIKEQGDNSGDEETHENSVIKSAHIYYECSENSNDSSKTAELLQSDDIELDDENCVQKQFNVVGEDSDKFEKKIQEIRQLWDNDDEGDNNERVKDGTEDGQITVVENECDKDNDNGESLIVDVSWEPSSGDNDDGICVVQSYMEKSDFTSNDKLFGTVNQTVKDVQVVDYQCFICSETFTIHKKLQDHISNVHKETHDKLCTLCMKSFTSMNSLKRHMLIHTGVKPYICDICGRKFSQTSILKRHKYTHGKRKPFECNFCQKSYTQKMNLLTHLKNHGVRMEPIQYKCKLCSKSFVHPSGLSRHLKQHKGVKFTCSHCHKTFSDSSALTRHVKSAHSYIV